MPPVSHQTIKLSRGKHSASDGGACVMELASMLGSETFSDHPRSVSRPLAAFMRSYNDRVDDDHRQELYRFASAAVGTASTTEVEVARARRLIAWGDERWRSRGGGRFLQRARQPRSRDRMGELEAAGAYAVGSIGSITSVTHRAALALIEELIALGAPAAEPARAARRPVRLESLA
jgi:hypothetical protein